MISHSHAPSIKSTRPVHYVSEKSGIHAYFDIIPESPDGSKLAWFSFPDKELDHGSVMVTDLKTDEEHIIYTCPGVPHSGARQGWLDNNHLFFSTEGQIFITDTHGKIETCVSGAVDTLCQANRLALSHSQGIRKFGGTPEKEEACYRIDFERDTTTELLERDRAWEILTSSDDPKYASLTEDIKQQMSFKHTKWAPDGKKWMVVFDNERYRKSIAERSKWPDLIKVILTADINGNDAKLLGSFTHHPNWLPDSSGLFAFKGTGAIRLWKLNGRSVTEEIMAETPFEGHPAISPNMRYIATDGFFYPDETHASLLVHDRRNGEQEIMVETPYPRVSWQTDHPKGTLGHMHPVWSYDGRRLYFNVFENERPRFCYIQFDQDADELEIKKRRFVE